MNLSQRIQIWRRQYVSVLLQGLLLNLGCFFFSYFGICALADRTVSISGFTRVILFVFGVLCSLWICVNKGIKVWFQFNWKEMFSRSTVLWPQSEPYFFSAMQLRKAATASGISQELLHEHCHRADQLANSIDDTPLYLLSMTTWNKRFLIISIFIFTLNLFYSDRASWKRVLMPWSHIVLERWVDIDPGNRIVDLGFNQTIRVSLKPIAVESGVRLAQLAIETRSPLGVWRSIPWSSSDFSQNSLNLESIVTPIDYRIHWRDIYSSSYQLTPVAAPRWATLVATVRDRTGVKTFNLSQETSLSARRGNIISLEATADTPLLSAQYRLSSLPSDFPLRFVSGIWKAEFSAQQNATFTFNLVSKQGRHDPAPPTYSLKIAEDLPPTIELLSPQIPLVASPEDSLSVTFSARDDHAITQVALKLAIPGQGEQTLRVEVPKQSSVELLSDMTWPLKQLRPGTKAQFWLEVSDDANPVQIGKSAKGSIEIVDANADHAATLLAMSKAIEAVDQAAQMAEQSEEASLKNDLPQSKLKTDRLSTLWPEATKALNHYAELAEKDVKSDPGLAMEVDRASEEFRAAQEQVLPAAQMALSKQNGAAAAKEQASLAAQARGVSRALREGSQAQSAEDFADRMERAGQNSEEMANAAESLASRGSEGSVSPAELEALEKTLAEVEKALGELRQAIKSLPQMSPEQMTGQSQDMPLDSARQAAGDLRRALMSGDVASAAKAAKRLAQDLKQMAKTLSEAGRKAAQEHGRKQEETSKRVVLAWKAAIAAQVQAVELSRAFDDERITQNLIAQREMLEKKLTQMVMPAPNAQSVQKALTGQSDAISKVLFLHQEIMEAAKEQGYLSGRTLRLVESALDAQREAESFLKEVKSAEALERAEKALEILQGGANQADSSASSSMNLSPKMGMGSSSGGGKTIVIRSASAGGNKGIRQERVKLPSSQDYLPPKELREELKRSLSEPRPAASDSDIKEYFKRLIR